MDLPQGTSKCHSDPDFVWRTVIEEVLSCMERGRSAMIIQDLTPIFLTARNG
jgi:hypothetical protein